MSAAKYALLFSWMWFGVAFAGDGGTRVPSMLGWKRGAEEARIPPVPPPKRGPAILVSCRVFSLPDGVESKSGVLSAYYGAELVSAGEMLGGCEAECPAGGWTWAFGGRESVYISSYSMPYRLVERKGEERDRIHGWFVPQPEHYYALEGIMLQAAADVVPGGVVLDACVALVQREDVSRKMVTLTPETEKTPRLMGEIELPKWKVRVLRGSGVLGPDNVLVLRAGGNGASMAAVLNVIPPPGKLGVTARRPSRMPALPYRVPLPADFFVDFQPFAGKKTTARRAAPERPVETAGNTYAFSCSLVEGPPGAFEAIRMMTAGVPSSAYVLSPEKCAMVEDLLARASSEGAKEAGIVLVGSARLSCVEGTSCCSFFGRSGLAARGYTSRGTAMLPIVTLAGGGVLFCAKTGVRPSASRDGGRLPVWLHVFCAGQPEQRESVKTPGGSFRPPATDIAMRSFKCVLADDEGAFAFLPSVGGKSRAVFVRLRRTSGRRP